ncbi:hypothetical protein M8818_006589 [Zalaria obscura]|uniref:Uncharacterized protein n=1 Tax=Zalaria obscura TaxID=2024903 RepID=A0ACC3S680_9PEZI
MLFDDLEACVNLIEVVCTPESMLNPFGKVVKGHATLCGPVCEAVCRAGGVDRWPKPVGNGYTLRLVEDTESVEGIESVEDIESRYYGPSNVVFFDTAEDEEASLNQTVYCLIVAQDVVSTMQKLVLVLYKCGDHADQFKRVGFVFWDDLPVSDIPKRTITIV